MIGLFFGMDARFLLALYLLCVLEVDCQTFPHLSFGDIPISNHGYVDLGMVGTSFNNSVQCHTHNGQWYFPDGEPLQNNSGVGDIYQVVASTRVDLGRRNDNNLPIGIYHCDVAVSGNADRATLYVGLYINGGKYLTEVIKGQFTIIIGGSISIYGDIMFNSDQRTLTCISTGGPATAVSWTRDSTTVITEGTETVLNDPETAQYTHTLTVTTWGMYTCTVSNDKPLSVSASFELGIYSILVGISNTQLNVFSEPSPPTDVAAVPTGPTSIRVTWTPPTPQSWINNYTISYSNTGCTDSDMMVDIASSATIYTLDDLEEGTRYSIVLTATLIGGKSASATTGATTLTTG